MTTRTIEISALNISMHTPHSPQGYVDLIVHARRKKKIFRQGEVHALMLGSLIGTKSALASNELRGEVFRFVNVNADEPWFNTQTNEQASDEEVAALNIPENLRAHMQRIEFVFYPKEHELWFISRDGSNRLGPSRAARFFKLLLDDVTISRELPDVEVTVIPDKTALEQMFKVFQLNKIVMQFKRPNPDDAADIQARIMGRMEAQKVKTMNEELIAARGQSIKPDAQTLEESKVAALNGFVEVHGKDADGLPVHESTVDKPLRLSVRVNTNIETAADVLLRSRVTV